MITNKFPSPFSCGSPLYKFTNTHDTEPLFRYVALTGQVVAICLWYTCPKRAINSF
ncbi:hypothetical protein WN944_004702 [Citrus x changshan-huyou]|uniref:Uncharacterized protein n=1 Tax=Citrus x changshan-huyou TaxID=2935761 RepID=A0AAP0M4F9_9ROSI